MDMKEKIEPVRTEKKRPRGRWKDSHVVLFVLLVVLTILFPGGGIFYLCGRFRPYPLALGGVLMLYLAVIVFMVYCFFLGIVRLSGRREKCTRNERLLIIGETSVPLIFFGLIIALFLFREAMVYGPGPGLLIVGLRDRIENKVDIGATRAWLQSLGPEDYDDRYTTVSSAELPESLRVSKHAVAQLSADANGNAKVRVQWGSGMMGHLGVEIGMEDMETPPSEFSPQVNRRLPLEPGAHVFWEE